VSRSSHASRLRSDGASPRALPLTHRHIRTASVAFRADQEFRLCLSDNAMRGTWGLVAFAWQWMMAPGSSPQGSSADSNIQLRFSAF
jgi:hypothetical protein